MWSAPHSTSIKRRHDNTFAQIPCTVASLIVAAQSWPVTKRGKLVNLVKLVVVMAIHNLCLKRSWTCSVRSSRLLHELVTFQHACPCRSTAVGDCISWPDVW